MTFSVVLLRILTNLSLYWRDLIVPIVITLYLTLGVGGHGTIRFCLFTFLREIESFYSIGLSLSLRLCCNVLGGHLVCELVVEVFNSPNRLWLLMVYEIFVRLTQASIFVLLSSLYLEERVKDLCHSWLDFNVGGGRPRGPDHHQHPTPNKPTLLKTLKLMKLKNKS